MSVPAGTDQLAATDQLTLPAAPRHGTVFAKGHGTGNDFVILPDPDGELALTPQVVAALCDRRHGIGGDGVLRVVRSRALPGVAEFAGTAPVPEWFMDYWNADGSLAEMCGNGTRVFARYLTQSGLADAATLTMLTRSGPVLARVDARAVAVTMPATEVSGPSRVRVGEREFTGTMASCGNPHLVCRVSTAPDAPGALESLDLTAVPRLDPDDFPAGANVEFISVSPDARQARMRVIERGSGETLSCGSGACAVAAVVLRDAGLATGAVDVRVPGGELRVRHDGTSWVLTGPAVIVGAGRLDLAAIVAAPV